MFEILEFIIQENSFFSILKDMGVPKKAIEELRNIDIQTFQSHFLDTRPLSGSPIVWMNDISKDKQYKRWSNSLAQLLSPGWPNEIRYIAQNLYNFIAVIDPSTIKGLALVRNETDHKTDFLDFSRSFLC
jgi:UDP-glucose:glycoprotein glucosyltransferase